MIPSSSARSPRCLRGLLCGALTFASAALIAPEAAAAQPTVRHRLGTTSLGVPRLSWDLPPPMHLQPERARLMLVLPAEWMPRQESSPLGSMLDPKKSWEFRRASLRTRATLGTSVQFHLEDPSHSIDFGLRLMPRAAIAVLRFDPLAPFD